MLMKEAAAGEVSFWKARLNALYEEYCSLIYSRQLINFEHRFNWGGETYKLLFSKLQMVEIISINPISTYGIFLLVVEVLVWLTLNELHEQSYKNSKFKKWREKNDFFGHSASLHLFYFAVSRAFLFNISHSSLTLTHLISHRRHTHKLCVWSCL